MRAQIDTSKCPLDLIAIGRSSVDLYGKQYGSRLEDMRSFEKYIGGCPANIVVGSSRLGLNTGIITGVGDDHFGRFIAGKFAEEGVSTKGIITSKDCLTALAILGIEDQDTFPLIFYRDNCADMSLTVKDIDPDFIKSSSSLLVTGTHLSTDSVRKMSAAAIEIAKNAGSHIIFDVDYRPVLWGLTGRSDGEQRFVENLKVSKILQGVAADCDLIVGTEEEFQILGDNKDALTAIKVVRSLTNATIVCKRGALGCVVFEGEIPNSFSDGFVARGFDVEVYNVLGAGDAFMSGFLSGWLRGKELSECCNRANAAGAIVVSRHGCAPAIPTEEELQHFLKLKTRPYKLRKDKALEHIHWATTRGPQLKELLVFAFDHRTQFEDLAQKNHSNPEMISKFKELALDSILAMDASKNTLGVLIDGRYGLPALSRANNGALWVGRPIELPGSRPLKFDTELNIGAELSQWPTHTAVKCLCNMHPNDPPEMLAVQMDQIKSVYMACRESNLEFLLEIICNKANPADENTVATLIRNIYDIHVYPDWWKLEPDTKEKSWNNISLAIEENDPFCRGVVLLGLNTSFDELKASFNSVKSVPIVRGFVIGRTIFAKTAEDWFANKISDDQAVKSMQSAFRLLISAWHSR